MSAAVAALVAGDAHTVEVDGTVVDRAAYRIADALVDALAGTDARVLTLGAAANPYDVEFYFHTVGPTARVIVVVDDAERQEKAIWSVVADAPNGQLVRVWTESPLVVSVTA
jgi:hypothetical protein